MSKINNAILFLILLGCCVNSYAEEPDMKSPNTTQQKETVNSSPIENPEQLEDKKNWQSAKQENTVEAYKKYLQENANGAYRSEAVKALVSVAEKIILENKTEMTDEEIKKVCYAFKIAAENESARAKEYVELPLCKDANKRWWE